MAPRHTHDTAAPRVSGKPGPPPKWHALLDRVAANPLDAGSRHAEPRHIGSALSVKADRGPDRPSVGRIGRNRATAGHDPTIETALDALRARARRRSERQMRGASERRGRRCRGNAPFEKRDRKRLAEARDRAHHEHERDKRRRREDRRDDRRDDRLRRVIRARDDHHRSSSRRALERGESSPCPGNTSRSVVLGGADNRAKLESAIERARRVEAESAESRDRFGKPSSGGAPSGRWRCVDRARTSSSCWTTPTVVPGKQPHAHGVPCVGLRQSGKQCIQTTSTRGHSLLDLFFPRRAKRPTRPQERLGEQERVLRGGGRLGLRRHARHGRARNRTDARPETPRLIQRQPLRRGPEKIKTRRSA